MRFETRRMMSFLNMVRGAQDLELDSSVTVCSTGGGARKYAAHIMDVFHHDVPKADELSTLVHGLHLLLRVHRDALFRVDPNSYLATGATVPVCYPAGQPYLLVNIGSGVSILRVDADGGHRRVGGTSLGGATFFGLCSKLTGCASFAEALALAERGTATNVDLLVGDIYGGDYAEYGLAGSLVAASMGKLSRPDVRVRYYLVNAQLTGPACVQDCATARPEDMARGVLDAITNNIVGCVCCLNVLLYMLMITNARRARWPSCTRRSRTSTRWFLRAASFATTKSRVRSLVACFLPTPLTVLTRHLAVSRLSTALHYWSKGQREALFLRHEGYVGAVGAMLMGSEDAARAESLP
jgi:type II pantothenate kinase